MATTYAELQAEVIDALHRGDIASRVPTWIEAGLQRVNNELLEQGGLPNQEQIAYTATVANQESIALPTDYAAMRWVKLDYSTGAADDPLESMNYESMLERYGDTTGQPRACSYDDDSIYMRPIPDASYSMRIEYLKRYASFASGNDTNFLLTRGGNILLYAALLEATAWIDNDRRIQIWGSAYREAMRNLRTLARRSRAHRPQMMSFEPELLAIGGNSGSSNIFTG